MNKPWTVFGAIWILIVLIGYLYQFKEFALPILNVLQSTGS